MRKDFVYDITPCYWNSNRICDKERQCDACEHMPPDDEKPNGKSEPKLIVWKDDYGGLSPFCPACGEYLDNFSRCVFCGQRIVKDKLAEEWEKPPELVTMDCFLCGGKNTLQGTRARSNGHFHGQCIKCGAKIIE